MGKTLFKVRMSLSPCQWLIHSEEFWKNESYFTASLHVNDINNSGWSSVQCDDVRSLYLPCFSIYHQGCQKPDVMLLIRITLWSFTHRSSASLPSVSVCRRDFICPCKFWSMFLWACFSCLSVCQRRTPTMMKSPDDSRWEDRLYFVL